MRSKQASASWKVSLIILTAGLTACATSSPVAGSCSLVPLVTYSAEFSAEFLRLWEQVPEGNALDVYIKDSMDLKDAVRDCRGN